MATKPILFSGPMVRAIIDGRKTQTRRVIKPQPVYSHTYTGIDYYLWEQNGNTPVCRMSPKIRMSAPYQVGDVLWVRETFCDCEEGACFRATPVECTPGKWRPSIFMPKHVCRLFLKITRLDAVMLQDLSLEDARAEGITEYLSEMGENNFKVDDDTWRNRKSVENFAALWDSLNAERGFGWDTNPWLWKITFEQTGMPDSFLKAD